MPSDLASSVRTTVIGAGELKVVCRMREPVTTSSPTLVPDVADDGEGAGSLLAGGVAAAASAPWALAASGAPANTIPLRPPMMVVASSPFLMTQIPSARLGGGPALN